MRAVYRVQAILHAATLTAEWIAEDYVRICGYDVLIFLFVALALLSVNVLSLAYIAAAGVGLFWKARAAEALPRIAAPLLAVLLLSQYALLMPSWSSPERTREALPASAAWLGFAPTSLSVALLFVTLSAAAAQAHCNAWRRRAVRSAHVQPPESASVSPRSSVTAPLVTSSLADPFASAEQARSVEEEQTAAMCTAPAQLEAHRLYHLIHALPNLRHTSVIELDGDCAALKRSGSGESAPQSSLSLACSARWGVCRSMSVHARAQWGWPDHLRFWVLRFSLDALMIFIVGFCCFQRDLIHAAYLALTLYLFRRREGLRLRGNGLFVWMLAANYCVLVSLLLFQIPVGSAWRSKGRAEQGEETCTFAHLLGLHHITGAGQWSALGKSPHGAGLSLLMWLAVQVRMSVQD